VVVFPRPSAENNGENDHNDVHNNVHNNVQEKLTDRQRDIIRLMQEDLNITYEQMSTRLGVSKKTIQRAIKDMRHIVHREGGNFGGSWIIEHNEG